MAPAPSPSGSLLRDPQTVQVGLLPAAASLLGRVDVAGEEGPCGAAVGGGGPVAVLLRVPLIGQVVGVLEGAVLVSGCGRTEWRVDSYHRRREKTSPGESCQCGEPYTEVQAPIETGYSGAFWTSWSDPDCGSSSRGLRRRSVSDGTLNEEETRRLPEGTQTLTRVLGKARSDADLQGFARGLQNRHVSLTLHKDDLARAAPAQEAPVLLLQLHLQSEQTNTPESESEQSRGSWEPGTGAASAPASNDAPPPKKKKTRRAETTP